MKEIELYFILDDLWRWSVLDGYNAVITCGLYEYIRDNEIKSYIFDTPEDKKEEFERLYNLADFRCLHSGASYGITMRLVERLIRQGYDDWKIWYINHNRPDMIKSMNKIIRQCKESLSDPSYKLCRNRLRRECFELIINDL